MPKYQRVWSSTLPSGTRPPTSAMTAPVSTGWSSWAVWPDVARYPPTPAWRLPIRYSAGRSEKQPCQNWSEPFQPAATQCARWAVPSATAPVETTSSGATVASQDRARAEA